MAQYRLERALKVAVDPLLVVIMGPTASGKTGLSLEIAERFAGEIVSCDSVAMYREFEVGTAKPTAAEQSRAPHHLLSVAEPAASITAGEYARLARDALAGVAARRKLPIVVGGTGLYLRALLDGLFPGPQRSEELRQRLREAAERRGSEYLHRILQRLDAEAAGNIHPNDLPKLVRAVEVCLASCRPMTQMWKAGRAPLRGFRILRLGLTPKRSLLYERINQRAQRMFDSGLIDETRQLIVRHGEGVWPLSSLGYRQAVQHLNGEIDLAGAIHSSQQGHRNYAKRQMTWFRREPDVKWLAGFGDDPEIQHEATDIVQNALRA